ncbi:YciI family protein [Gymnodinialimonas sp. 2305UL16-5]|uniref:YciI family protein n=1 Tax=Gymnodinialimonas mytili TaxID=3126503 RepID=UPI0030987B53
MRYTFLLYSNPADFAHMGPDDWVEMKAVYGQYIGALQEAGIFVDTDWLHPADTATTLSLKGGEKEVQDGPVAETRETLGGYFVIDVPDLDAAMAWAEKCPAAQMGKIEIRASAMESV